MKKYIFFLFIFCLQLAPARAQWVTIPDANFATKLQQLFPSCMNGNLMDTTCTNITTAATLYVNNLNISNLSGIEYFDGLTTLHCNNNQLTSLPILPVTLTYLNCNYNQLASLPNLPANLQTLWCNNNQLTSLPILPTNLTLLYCHINQLTSLPTLPAALTELQCFNNQLTSLPFLPANLEILNCRSNQLISLPNLPVNLEILYCEQNLLTSLPTLPANLITLYCNHNLLTSLPTLPANLTLLYCFNNQLTSLPILPANLNELRCNNNQLTSLPILPTMLTYLNCNYNLLSSLSNLPANLTSLGCINNQLTSLPTLPANLTVLNCYDNQLTSLPNLPSNLIQLKCENNNIPCFPTFPSSIINPLWFSIANNPFTCLPNYVAAMDALTLAFPLCVDNDTVNNNAGCASAEAIVGYSYKDSNNNCIKDLGELGKNNITIKLYDVGNNLIAQTYSFANGLYNFVADSGTYTVKVDTTGMPFTVQCNYPGIDSTMVLTNVNPLVTNVNFDIVCKPGFDIGTQSVVRTGWVFPGQTHRLRVLAGDMSHWINMNCADGIAGQVTITVLGPVTYNGIVAGALTPNVAGNVFTYTVADFGSINFIESFGLKFTTDTNAQAGTQICVNVIVTPTIGDNNTTNNIYDFCYQVLNSYDPNMKEVYPVNVLPGYDDWFTYTIHFQNTGNAPAFNIRLRDTLDANLDINTFEIRGYSHPAIVSINGNILTVRFNNIMLPDSTTDYEGSMGYFQYRIKPLPNLPLGTQIENTAYIYFDFNAPIITNTTQNNFQTVTDLKSIDAKESNFVIYPNPSSGIYFFKDNRNLQSIEVYNMMGELILSQGNDKQINLQAFPKGIYVARINSTMVVKMIKE